jgi:manganese oxidase
VPVGAIRAVEFVADNPGDWALHCHKSHHVMNAMGHRVPTMIGVDHRGVAEKIRKLVPDYMVMGERGGAMDHEMPLPENTLPMMTGTGPFGQMEMGGMFTVVKVREGLARNDYKDPGWYRHPAASVAYEWKGDMPAPTREPAASHDEPALRARKPARHTGH